MVTSGAATVEAYLAELPPERRAVVVAVRSMVLAHLPEGYAETMLYGMISYVVPLARYPRTYNGQPLAYLSLAAQKRHYALYLNGVYATPGGAEGLAAAYRVAGKRLDMGKSCLRFGRLDDLAVEAVAAAIRAVPPDAFIALYEASRARR